MNLKHIKNTSISQYSKYATYKPLINHIQNISIPKIKEI